MTNVHSGLRVDVINYYVLGNAEDWRSIVS